MKKPASREELEAGTILLHRPKTSARQPSEPVRLELSEIVGVAQSGIGSDVILASGVIVMAVEQYHQVETLWLTYRHGVCH